MERYVGDEVGEFDPDLNATWDGNKWIFHENNGQDNTVVFEPEPIQNDSMQAAGVAIAIGLAPPQIKLGAAIGAAGGLIIVGGVILLHDPVPLVVPPPPLSTPTFVQPDKVQIGSLPPPPPLLNKRERRTIRNAARKVGISYILCGTRFTI